MRWKLVVAVVAVALDRRVLDRAVHRPDLERQTEPPDLVQGDEACSEGREGLVDVVSAFVAHGQAAESVEPSVGPLDDLAVTAEFLAALDTLAGDARDDAACTTLLPPDRCIVSFVGVQLVRPVPRSAAPTRAQRRNGIEGGRHLRAVVPIGARQEEAERRAAGIGDEVALRARLAPVRRVRASGRAPFFAGTETLSRLARLQSISRAA